MATRFDDWEGDFLAHHGTRGMKWGVRRYQNPDGSLTSEGRKHYGYGEGGSQRMSKRYNRQVKKLNRLAGKADVEKQAALSEKYKKRAKVGAKVTAGLAAGTAGSYLSDLYSNRRMAKDFEQTAKLWDKDWSDNLAKIQKWQRQPGGLDGATYGHLRNLMDRAQNNGNDMRKLSAKYGALSAPGAKGSASLRTKALAGATVVAGGYTAYAAIRSKVAKARTTDKGHAKAVEKYRKQYSKMIEQFDNTPYAELVRKQRKKV